MIVTQHRLTCQAENPPYGRRATGAGGRPGRLRFRRRPSPDQRPHPPVQPAVVDSRRNDRPGRRRAHSASSRGPGRMGRGSTPVGGRRRVPAFPSWPVSLPSGLGRPSHSPGRTVEEVLDPNSRHEENAFPHDKSDSRSRSAHSGDVHLVRPGEGLRFPRSGQRLVRHLLPGAGLDRGRPRHPSLGAPVACETVPAAPGPEVFGHARPCAPPTRGAVRDARRGRPPPPRHMTGGRT